MKTQKFQKGDVVMHKASGEKGVIAQAIRVSESRCNPHTYFTGNYTVSYGFGKQEITEEEILEFFDPSNVDVKEKERSELNQIAMGCKPDPSNFTVRHLEIVKGNTIIIANYGGYTFNGNKLMVLKGKFHEDELKTLDPHFLNEDHPVVARFIPNEEGLELARLTAKVL